MIMREIAANDDDVTLDSRLPARALQVFMCGARTGLSVGPLWAPTRGSDMRQRIRSAAAARRRARVAALFDRTRAPPAVGRLTCHMFLTLG